MYVSLLELDHPLGIIVQGPFNSLGLLPELIRLGFFCLQKGSHRLKVSLDGHYGIVPSLDLPALLFDLPLQVVDQIQRRGGQVFSLAALLSVHEVVVLLVCLLSFLNGRQFKIHQATNL